MIPLKWTKTYDLVTPESAENSDVADRGFVLPDGTDLSMADAPVGPEFEKWCDEHGPVEHEGSFKDFVEAVKNLGIDDISGLSVYGRPYKDAFSGAERTEAIHLKHDPGKAMDAIKRIRNVDAFQRTRVPAGQTSLKNRN